MIVTATDIDELACVIDAYEKDTTDTLAHVDLLSLLCKRPQLLIPSGFDEIRIDPTLARTFVELLFNELRHRGTMLDPLPTSRPHHLAYDALEFILGVHCRDASSGGWYKSAAVERNTNTLVLRSELRKNDRSLSLQDLLGNCRRALETATHPAVLLLPNLWHAPSAMPQIQIAEASRALVLALKHEDIALKDITWSQLEDVVAEVLRQKGFHVHVTPRSADGGRDIIARGEMAVGEACILAVEVKHRPIVKINEIRNHLQANKDFPMLLVATSGRFSAGVVREKNKPENFLRLHLRDHQSLTDWIAAYA